MTKVTIVGAVLDKDRLELYKEDGSSILLDQGNPKLEKIVTAVLPVLQGVPVTLKLKDLTYSQTIYPEVEKKTNGLVKFFRVARSKLANIFSTGEVHEPKNKVAQKAADILKEIEAVSVNVETTQKFDKDTETIVAEVNGIVIPNMEHLDTHFIHMLKHLGSSEGITNLLKRLATMQAERGHTVEELLLFLKTADLPIANDGSIVIYKGLNTKPSKLGSIIGRFVDPHSEKVVQDVGDYVHMDESMVDPNRTRDCSQGLHVASKGYLSMFRTGSILLGKVNPEDIIAVPKNEPTKMRVKGYHLIALLPSEGAELVKRSASISTHVESQKILDSVILGKHNTPSRSVNIGGPKGTLVTHTMLDGSSEVWVSEPAKTTTPTVDTEAKDIVNTAPPVEVSLVTKTISKVKSKSKMTKAEELQKCVELYKAESDRNTRLNLLMNIMELKRSAKKSWEFLGISKADAKRITDAVKINKL